MRTQLYTPARKFQRLLDYMQRLDLDIDAIGARAGVNTAGIDTSDPDREYPTVNYSALYQAAAIELEQLHRTPPWAAGIGTDAFRFLCYSIISCSTLGEALDRAQRFQQLLFPVSGNRVQLRRDGDNASLVYVVECDTDAEIFSPQGWNLAAHMESVAKSSGLRIWYSFIGWLIGRSPELKRVDIAAGTINPGYEQRLTGVFQCPLHFDAAETRLVFDAAELDSKLIHDAQSLDAFLDNAIYTLVENENTPDSTSQAIRSLLAKQTAARPPSLETMAEDLHMSVSSLRRRLRKEDTSYQQIKDRYRCDLAIAQLRNSDLKIHEIAESLGFLEPGSFIRSFKSWTGMTPKAFREQLKSFG